MWDRAKEYGSALLSVSALFPPIILLLQDYKCIFPNMVCGIPYMVCDIPNMV